MTVDVPPGTATVRVSVTGKRIRTTVSEAIESMGPPAAAAASAKIVWLNWCRAEPADSEFNWALDFGLVHAQTCDETAGQIDLKVFRLG